VQQEGGAIGQGLRLGAGGEASQRGGEQWVEVFSEHELDGPGIRALTYSEELSTKAFMFKILLVNDLHKIFQFS